MILDVDAEIAFVYVSGRGRVRGFGQLGLRDSYVCLVADE